MDRFHEPSDVKLVGSAWGLQCRSCIGRRQRSGRSTINLLLCFVTLIIGACVGACTSKEQAGANEGEENLIFADTCDAPKACGGDWVGTWRMITRCETFNQATRSSSCFTGSNSFHGSEEATLQFHQIAAIGYRWQREHNQTFSGQYPEGCHASASECQKFAADFQYSDARTQASGTCSFANARCACDLKQSILYDEYGIYEIKGNQATLTPAGGGSHNPTEVSYCVTGDEMSISAMDGSFVAHFQRTSKTTTF